ncbi:MAG: glycosyltransferase family 2 protein [Acidobacteria bacterium]|nr:glycosyltransferase family 2 protein [Acidobacteriota bacterium]
MHYGNAAVTRRCLQSLARIETGSHRVIVVDHGPDPGLAKALEDAHPSVEILSAHGNPGFGAGCNLGAKAALEAGAQALWFLNNDATLDTPLLEAMGALARSYPEIGLWGTHQLDGDQRLGADRQPEWFSRGVAFHPRPIEDGARALGPCESLSGASVFLTRAAWETVGSWPERYFLYWEDAAWCRQALDAGLGLALTDLTVIHPRGTTTGRHSARTLYYGARNGLLFHRQIHPNAWLKRWIMGLNQLQKRFFRGQWHYLPPIAAGVWDALKTPPREGRRELP